MALTPGTRVGRYDVLGSLGAGGMGEVYRARDTRLGRDVALKVVPAALEGDAERRARFDREAQLLAALNHGNIAQIYGIEDLDVGMALVLELVEGPTLAERVEQGPIPVAEVLAFARQIAEALEAAHEQGIVHRDLKPSNVKLRPDGTVKVLDFGLAKLVAADPSGSVAGLSLSPTITTPAMTQAGVIMGTAAYMSPEQARGKATDKRADIWAFGVVLYEMLSGGRLFDAETMSDTIAAVLTRQPDLQALPAGVPVRIRTLLQRCLDRDPLTRLRDIGEARLVLSAGAQHDLPSPEPAQRPRMSRTAGWAAAALAGVLAGGLAVGYGLGLRPSPPPDPRRLVYEIPLPPDAELRLASKPSVAIAPDGSAVVFVATADGVSRLYLRTQDQVAPRVLPGTEDAAEPVFSPDGKWIAFTADRDLRKVPLDGGAVTLASGLVLEDSRGVAWTDRNEIVFAPDPRGGLLKISADGGPVTPLTTLDAGKGERTHRWPVALPGGRIVLFTVGSRSSPDDYENAQIDAVDVDTSKRWTVAANASLAKYLASGQLMLARGGILSTVSLDVETATISGVLQPLFQGVAGDVTSGAVHVSAANDGTLAYIPGTSGSNLRRLVWADRAGAVTPVDLPPAVYGDPKISPDGGRAAVLVGANGSGDVHVYDFARSTFTPFTFDGRNASPAWSGDGREIFYVGLDADGTRSRVFRRPADGSRNAEEVTSMDSIFYLTQVIGKGEAVIGDYFSRPSTAAVDPTRSFRGFDAIRQPATPGATPVLLAADAADDYGGLQSPDGQWLLYMSQRTGRPEVYVRDLNERGGIWQVSSSGGEEPRWTPDGREILYRSGTRLFAVAVQRQPTFRAERARVILDGVYDLRSETLGSYDIDPKTGRLLMVRLEQAPNAARAVRVVVNAFRP